MSENLSIKQQKLIACLVAGSTILDASQQVGIAEKTAHVWLKQPAFHDAYESARKGAIDELWAAAMAQLKAGVPLAIATLKRHASTEMLEITASSQLRASVYLIDKSFEIDKVEELAARLAALEERLK